MCNSKELIREHKMQYQTSEVSTQTKEPLISVIMPVYNGEAFLATAIESVLNQTIGDFELLIVYDESTDGSFAVIEHYQRYDHRIKVIGGQRRTLIAALNKGIDVARGKYIARMDADDISLPERFSKQVALMESEHADICGCHFVMVDPEDRVIQYVSVPTSSYAIALYCCVGSPFPHPGVMLRTASIKKASLYYGTGPFEAIEDLDLWARMIFSGLKPANVDEVLLKYRIHGFSISHQKELRIRSETSALIDSIFRANRDNLERCFSMVMNQKAMALADTIAAANFVFLDMILRLGFTNARILCRRVGLLRLLRDIFPAFARRFLAVNSGFRLKIRSAIGYFRS